MVARHGGNLRAPAVIDASAKYGRLLVNGGEIAEGIRLQAQALDHSVAVFGPLSLGAAFIGANLALSQYEAGALDAALASIDRASAAMAKATGTASATHAGVLQWRSMILVAARRLPEALVAADEAVAAFEHLQGAAGKDTLLARQDRIEALAQAGHLPQARKAFDALAADLPAGVAVDADPARARLQGLLLRLAGDGESALAVHQKALDGLTQTRKANLLRMHLLAEQGADLLLLGREEQAAAVLQQSLALSKRMQPHDTPARVEVVAALARASAR